MNHSYSDGEEAAIVTDGTVSILSVIQAKYKSAVTISTSGNSNTLKSNGTPDQILS